MHDRGPGKRTIKPKHDVVQDFLERADQANAASSDLQTQTVPSASRGGGFKAGRGKSGEETAGLIAEDDEDDDDEDWGAGRDLSKLEDSCSGSSSEESSVADDSESDASDGDGNKSSSDGGAIQTGTFDTTAARPAWSVVSSGHPTPSEAADRQLVSETLPVCGICLGSENQDDEIVQCDKCGLEVHTLCYGIALCEDNGDEPDGEIVPWFCEPCRAGFTNPACMACPVDGGAFKQLDVDGRWIHMTCAKYIEHAQLGDSISLSPVVIDVSGESYKDVSARLRKLWPW